MLAHTRLSGLERSEDRIQTIRSFNRFYTRHIGVLEKGLLQSRYTLLEVRLLYEVAHRKNVTATELSRELGIDAGYLSRILRSFQKRGWMSRKAHISDGRQALLALTSKGLATLAPLEERSNQQVKSMLDKIPLDGQQVLVRAMCQIEEVLSPENKSTEPYLLRSHQPGDIGWIVYRHGVLYSKEYRYDERFEALVAKIVAEFVEKFDAKRERCWIAEREGQQVGSVMLVRKSKTVAKLRLLLVEPSARGMGIGKRLVEECVRFAKLVGYKKIVLWTQSELKAARKIYENAGFRLVGEESHQSWGRDDLVAETWELKL
jgi:DNA-binding MarR family transcriptional regulator/N-acetylglutamate synthase-like GNAT family acetyltransferase